MDEHEVERLFQEGVAAIRAGDKAKARDLLTRVVEAQQMHEQAWLWLSAAVTDREEQILCLENVLTINPSNEVARRGMTKLGGKVPELAAEPEPPKPPPAPEPAPAKPAEDAWRSRLKDDDYVSDATIVKPMHQGPKLGVLDLANAWVWATIFQIEGPYQEHVDYGPFSHNLISIAASILFGMVGLGVYAGIFLANPKSITALRQLMSSSLPRGAASTNLQSLIPTGAAAANLGVVLLLVFVILVIVTFVGLFFEAIVMSRVAEWMGGKGSIVQLTQALTISMVPSQLVMIPFYIASALILAGPTPGLAQFVVLVGNVYQFAQTSNAVNASHKLGIFASMGAVIISNIAMTVIICCLGFVMLSVLGPPRR